MADLLLDCKTVVHIRRQQFDRQPPDELAFSARCHKNACSLFSRTGDSLGGLCC
jgi:hypothetical protein